MPALVCADASASLWWRGRSVPNVTARWGGVGMKGVASLSLLPSYCLPRSGRRLPLQTWKEPKESPPPPDLCPPTCFQKAWHHPFAQRGLEPRLTSMCVCWCKHVYNHSNGWIWLFSEFPPLQLSFNRFYCKCQQNKLLSESGLDAKLAKPKFPLTVFASIFNDFLH